MKNIKTSALISLLSVCVSGILVPHTRAQDTSAQPQIKSIVEGLLVTHWEKGKANRTESVRLFENASTDRSVLLAYTLNRMQHNRNGQALTSASELTRRYPDDVDGWILKAWLDAVTDNFNRALVSMTSLKKAISNVNVVLDADTEQMVLNQLGRLIGYMQGPAKPEINPDTLQRTIEKVTDGLTPAQLKSFNQRREEVLATFESRLQQRGAKEKEETDKAIVEAQVQTQQIQDQNRQVDLDQSKILPRIDLLRQESAKQVAALQSQLLPLQTAGSSLSSQIDAARSDLQILRWDIILVQNALINDPRNFFLNQQLVYLINQARLREFDIARIFNDLNRIDAQIGSINVQIAQTHRQYNSQIAVLSEELKLGERIKRRNLKKLAKLAKGPKVILAKLSSIDIRTDALTTYDPFPIEWYRERLIKKLN